MTFTTTAFAPVSQDPRPRVLLVDDEPAVLDGLRRQLRRDYTITTATGGAEALQLLDSEPPFAVVISDMRMPGMDGATLLAQVREHAPNTVRMLLTGQADIDAAISAINNGQIFRFLTKPCPPEILQGALDDAAELNRLITAENELLEKTLRGAIQALIDTLSLAHPKAFSRAVRIARTVNELAEALRLEDRWEVEITAMLSQLGAASLPPSVLDKLNAGMPLDSDEKEMVNRVPSVSEQLLAAIPRLERVATAVGLQRVRYDGLGGAAGGPKSKDIPLAARMLRLAVDFDALASRRVPALTAISQMRDNQGAYDPDLLDALAGLFTVGGDEDDRVEVTFDKMQPGMVLMDDVLSRRGILLLGRGSVVTSALLQRLQNHVEREGISGSIVVSKKLRR